MLHVLIGCYDPKEVLNYDFFLNQLRTAGFSTDIVQPSKRVPDTLKSISISGGIVHALVLGIMGDHAEEFGINNLVEANIREIDIVRSIRNIDEDLHIMNSVRVRTLPIVLVKRVEIKETLSSFDWFEELGVHEFSQNPSSLVTKLLTVITKWRQSLLEELDYVGFAITINSNGEYDVCHALQRKRKQGEILSDEGTPGSLRSAQFLILAQDFLEEFSPYLELKHLLDNYRAIASKDKIKPETVFQRYFEANPHLIKRDLFDRHWAQPKLRIPDAGKKHFRPDFVFRPKGSIEIGTKWQIMDLKLPEEPLVVNERFHPSLSKKLINAVQQLQNYREYFNREDTQEELVRRFGFRPLNPKLAVLIGRRDQMKNPDLLDKVQGPRYLDVDILTYDEVLDIEANRLATQSSLLRLF